MMYYIHRNERTFKHAHMAHMNENTLTLTIQHTYTLIFLPHRQGTHEKGRGVWSTKDDAGSVQR